MRLYVDISYMGGSTDHSNPFNRRTRLPGIPTDTRRKTVQETQLSNVHQADQLQGKTSRRKFRQCGSRGIKLCPRISSFSFSYLNQCTCPWKNSYTGLIR